MRRVNRVFFLGVLSLLVAPAALAAPTGSTPPPLITVVTSSGDTLRAICVEPSGIGMVRITDASGRYEFRPANRIRRVLDDTGADRTRDALDRRRVVGARPAGEFEPLPAPARPLRYGPRSVTRAFGITETSAFGRIGNARRYDRSIGFAVDLGRAYNVTAHDALGLTAFYGGGDGWADLGVRARYRRWLGATSSIDFAPGIIAAHEEPGTAHGKGIGIVGQVAWNLSRYAGVVVQVQSVQRGDVTHYYQWFVSSDPVVEKGYRDTGVMIGLKLGGRPGLYSGLAGSMFALLAAAGTSHDLQGGFAPRLP